MRHLVFFVVASVATVVACSSSSSSDSSAADCSAHDVARLDTTTCAPTSVTGICVRSLGYNDASEEAVCAAGPDGAMYVIKVDGDTYLSGDGWTFGPREFGPEGGMNVYPVEPDSLSTTDHARCQTAISTCSGSPVEAGAGGDAAKD